MFTVGEAINRLLHLDVPGHEAPLAGSRRQLRLKDIAEVTHSSLTDDLFDNYGVNSSVACIIKYRPTPYSLKGLLDKTLSASPSK